MRNVHSRKLSFQAVFGKDVQRAVNLCDNIDELYGLAAGKDIQVVDEGTSCSRY